MNFLISNVFCPAETPYSVTAYVGDMEISKRYFESLGEARGGYGENDIVEEFLIDKI